MTNKIIVRLNPDVPPTGSDLGIVNAARKSFGKRSEWDFKLSHWETGPTREELEGQGYEEYDESTSGIVYYKLKDKDKRLLEFLARGMTADDFESFVDSFPTDTTNDWLNVMTELLWQWRNTPTHDTPFNHGFFSFEVKAPIFVARHLVKHQYLIMSEYSRRYITDDVEFYQPEVWRKAAADVKQGSSSEAITTSCVIDHSGVHTHPKFAAGDVNALALQMYTNMVTAGVAPEQARMVFPQSLMTSWTWSGTLGAFADMCKLRLSNDTQYETRLVAQAVYEELKRYFPVAAPLIVEGVL